MVRESKEAMPASDLLGLLASDAPSRFKEAGSNNMARVLPARQGYSAGSWVPAE